MSNFRTLLVIGTNHKEIAAKYSCTSTQGDEQIVRYKLTEAPKMHFQYMQTLDNIINTLQTNVNIPDREKQIDCYTKLYEQYSQMDDFEFFQELTKEYEHDTNGNAVTMENPDGNYMYEKCYDEDVRKDQTKESPFADPFILKDGTKAYSARVNEIEWADVHYAKADIYKNVWELCVEGREPQNDDEKQAKQIMGERKDYFAAFNSKEEYVGHCSAFWAYGVATEDGYTECTGRDIDWTNNFYDTFIKPLPGDTVISIYEIRLPD